MVRTNIYFILISTSLTPAFSLMEVVYWKLVEGVATGALKCRHAVGGLLFAICLLGWYLLAAQLLAGVNLPVNVPVGDLSGIVKGASERASRKVETKRVVVVGRNRAE